MNNYYGKKRIIYNVIIYYKRAYNCDKFLDKTKTLLLHVKLKAYTLLVKLSMFV